MDYIKKEDKLAFISCIEVALMRRGNTNYNFIVAKLASLYNCDVVDCFEHPEYLLTVLKQVYKEDYKSILDDIKLELDKLVGIEEMKAEFFKIMED